MPLQYGHINDCYLRHKEERIIEKNRRWYQEITHVIEEISHLHYAIIKGEVLSLLAYGDTGYRDSGDIDFLISYEDMKEMDRVLKSNGFEPVLTDDCGSRRALTREEEIMFRNSHQVMPYTKDQIDIDVNYNILWGEFQGQGINMEDFVSDTIELDIYGCKVKSLSLVKAFISLCLHHYREMNSIYLFKRFNPFEISMFQDIYVFCKRNMTVILEELLQLSQEYDIGNYIYYLLFHVRDVFKDSSLDSYVRLFESEDGKGLLNSYGLTDQERKQWKVDLQTRIYHDNLFSLVENDLSEKDLRKVELCLSIF